MTIKERVEQHLVEHGLFPDQAKVVVGRVVESSHAPDDVLHEMSSRWNDDAAGYPCRMFVTIFVSIKPTVLQWIDEALPKAWYRPMFVEGS